jgi:hypothetical protein
VPGNPFRTGRKWTSNAGFDFKAGLKSNLTLDLTVNPDFGQVEVDPAVINISDQETYYQEKRPFFIEGSSIFNNFGRGGPNAYKSYGWTDPVFFYSRRIGRTPQGRYSGPGSADMPDWTTILGAAKVTGKIGQGFSIGAVSALTQGEYADVDVAGVRSQTEVEPFTYYGAVRGLKEFGDGRSGLGFIGTAVLRDLKAGTALADALVRNAFALAADGWTFLGLVRLGRRDAGLGDGSRLDPPADVFAPLLPAAGHRLRPCRSHGHFAVGLGRASVSQQTAGERRLRRRSGRDVAGLRGQRPRLSHPGRRHQRARRAGLPDVPPGAGLPPLVRGGHVLPELRFRGHP